MNRQVFFWRIEMNKENEIKEIMKKPTPKRRVGIIRTQIVREGSMLYGNRRINNPTDAVELVKDIFRYADREMMVVVSLDSKNAPLALEIVSVGTVNTCLVSMREIFKHCILTNATSIMCFHNHPSGIPEASKEDIEVTRKLDEAGKLLGIWLLDHIIVGEGKTFVSLQERGLVKNGYQKAIVCEEG
jgi:DNA repair protein RadC